MAPARPGAVDQSGQAFSGKPLAPGPDHVHVPLQSPTDGFVTPHDVQTIINGTTYRQTLPAGEKVRVAPGAQGLVGPVGFRLD